MPVVRTHNQYARTKKLTYVFLLNLTYPLSRLEPRRSPLADLEVATDSPLCPTVAIISPTPRAFTFPPIIKDLPLPSPSSSPFKPDLKPLSTPPPMRTLSPTSTIDSSETSSVYSSSVYSSSVSTVSSQASHRRRRSVASDTERRPKKGDDDYIKRPENAFILFRRKCCEDRQMAEESAHEDPAAAPAKKQRQADLSKMISQQWKSLSAEERAHWEDLAKEKKKEHEQLYPNYVYRPQRVKDKSKGAKKGKGRKDGEGDTEPETMLSFVVPIPAPRNSSNERSHGSNRRAASAPTPPPQYQTVSIPAVYLPSCPSSPALIPRISRRTPLPRYPIPSPEDADPSTHFEYLPNDSFQPTSFQPRPSFDANMTSQPSDSFPIFQFGGQFADRNHGLPLQSLTIPRESTMYTTSNLISPSESVPSGIMSPAESIASSLPSSNGPFTPADALSMSRLSLANPPNEYGECIPDDEIPSATLGFGGYPWHMHETLWSNTDMLTQSDFDLASIPPVEIGLPALQEGDLESEYGQIMEEPEFGSEVTTPDGTTDPFSPLFTLGEFNNCGW
ncbi:hypothetical protein NLI96_g2939 [Meripilus lineatus]|uniref:HMG box domain-containing protein n=1 Tax=Meripilus lineatus TaxID=2056292 RepID=A0AAD5YLD9_9APHY|nr:hypothetical protein NLI96_g2939 [Physisporinus lineatus]